MYFLWDSGGFLPHLGHMLINRPYQLCCSVGKRQQIQGVIGVREVTVLHGLRGMVGRIALLGASIDLMG